MNILVQYRFVFVIALLALAVASVADRTCLPLALRGLNRAMSGKAGQRRAPVPLWRRLLALLLVLAAFLVALAG